MSMQTRRTHFWKTWQRIALVGGIALAALLSGCAGGSSYTVTAEELASGYLATEPEVPSHPDSLYLVQIVERENKLDIQMARPYEQIMRAWSSTWLSQSSQRTFNPGLNYRSYATLWSLDLSIASLVAEEGIEGLSKRLARKRIQQRRDEHRQMLQIDVYRFVGSPNTGGGISGTLVGGPGSRVVLRDGEGHEYRPARVQNGAPVEAIIAGRRALYRRNTFLFNRQVEGRDLFQGVQTLRLYINDSFNGRYYFSWSFEDIPSRTAPSS